MSSTRKKAKPIKCTWCETNITKTGCACTEITPKRVKIKRKGKR